MSAPAAPPFEVFAVRDFALECGATLPEARLAFRQRGLVGEGEPVLVTTAFAANPGGLAYLGAKEARCRRRRAG